MYLNDKLKLKYETSMLDFENTISKLHIVPGEEGLLYDTLKKLKNDISIIGQAMKMFAKAISPFFLLISRKVEHQIRSYTALRNIWGTRLQSMISDVSEDKFENTKIKSIPKDVLDARIDTALELHKIIQDTKRICEAKLNLDADTAWASDSIYGIQKDLNKLGLNVGKFNLIGKPSKDYSSFYIKNTIKNLNYSTSDLQEYLDKSKELINYVNKDETKKLTTIISTYFDTLAKQELALHDLENIDDSIKEEKLQEIEMKVIRLWNMTAFLNIMHKLSQDIFDDVYKLCRVAVNSTDKLNDDI